MYVVHGRNKEYCPCANHGTSQTCHINLDHPLTNTKIISTLVIAECCEGLMITGNDLGIN